MNHKLTIIGCGSALPTFQNNPSSQLLEMCDKVMMIDCGGGTQNAMRQMGAKTARLYNIFISHLHGDHCFGLIGLLSTWGMMHRTQDVHIYAHKDLERLMRPWMDYHCRDLGYEVIFHTIHPRLHETIYEDRTMTVKTIPLRHSVPTCGFLFEEKRMRRHIEQGIEPFRYAYCSDTGYKPAIVPYIKGVNVLYHEATYPDEFKEAAERYQHSTARQAAKIAKKAEVGQLIIGHFSARVTDQEIFGTEAREEFPNVIVAKERTTYEL